MAQRVLITGVAGFVGSHLAEYLLGEHPELEIHGIVRPGGSRDHLHACARRLCLWDCDLNDAPSLGRLVEDVRPGYVFHLAAQSYVPTSFKAPIETLANNILGQVHLLEALRVSGLDPVIHVAGSSQVYGKVQPHELPVRETGALRPMSPYAVSKATQDLLGWQYFASYGMRIVGTRAFNHSGPRRGDSAVESSFARQIAEIELGIVPPPLLVGNLQARRDFTDVRDVVRAYWMAVTLGEPGEVYNVASGRSWAIQEVLDMLLAQATVPIRVEPDPARLRPSDLPDLVGDATRFRQRTGWTPGIPFETTLRDLLDYWRARLRKAARMGT